MSQLRKFLCLAAIACLSPAAFADRIYPTDVNVRDFGAKGDGIADDTAALQAAADAAAKRAGALGKGIGGRNCRRTAQVFNAMPRLVFPAGTYRITGPVFFERNHFVVGMDGATVKAAADDIDVFVFVSTVRHFVEGLTVEGGARQFVVETFNNEAANFTARDCTFRGATRAAVDSHSWQLPKGPNRPKLVRIESYAKDKTTGKWAKDPRLRSPEIRGYNNSSLITVERCRFEDCQVATDINPDGAVFRELTVTTSVSTSCVFRVANNLHAYSLDVTVRRPEGATNLAVVAYGAAHGLLLEHSRFRSADGRGVALVRTEVKCGSYISNSLILRGLEVACGGCPEGAIVTCPNRKSAEFISVTDIADTTGRPVKAISFPDGISRADYDAFRRFQQFSSDLTYTILIGRNSPNVDDALPPGAAHFREPAELVPPPAAPLAVPRRAVGGEILWGPDYGVGLVATTNDTAALKRLFAVAASKPGSTVVLPPRVFRPVETIDVVGSFDVTAAGIARIETTNDVQTLFRVADGARVSFSHLFFAGGAHHVVCAARTGASVIVDSCLSFDAASAAFDMTTAGMTDDLQFVLNGGVHYHPLWYSGNARAVLAGAWFRSLPPRPFKDGFTEACAVVNAGNLRYQDILGVPCVFEDVPKDAKDVVPHGAYRWIDNCGGELHSIHSRFGSEWGGIPPVYDFNGGKVLIEGSYAYFYPRYTAHQPIVTDGVPADLRMFGVVCGFEVQMWYGGLKFLRRLPDGSLGPIPGANVRGNLPRIPPQDGAATRLSVRDFGAKGDGVTDDTAAFTAAGAELLKRARAMAAVWGYRNRAKPSGSKEGPRPQLWIPKGRYRLAGTAILESDAFVCGEEGATIVGDSPTNDLFYIAQAYRVRIEGLRFEGGRHAVFAETLNKESANIHIRDCTFGRTSADAVYSPSFKVRSTAKGAKVQPCGAWRKNAGGGWERNPDYRDENLARNNHSSFIIIDGCAFKDCASAVRMCPDGSVARNSTFDMPQGATNAALRLGDVVHGYNLRFTHYDGSAAVEAGGVSLWLEDATVTTPDGSGACVCRGRMPSGAQGRQLVLSDVRTDAGLKRDNAICRFTDAFPPIAALVRVTAEGPNPVAAFAFGPEENEKAFDGSRTIKAWPVDRFFSYGIRDCSDNVALPDGFAKRFVREIPDWAARGGGTRLKMPRGFDGVTPEVLEGRWYHDGRTREIVRDTVIDAAGVAALDGLAGDRPWFVVKPGAKLLLRNLQVRGGRSFVVVEPGGEAFVDSCYSYDAEGPAFACAADGRLFVDGGVYYAARLYEGDGDATLRSFWFRYTAVVPPDQPIPPFASIVNRGRLVAWDILGVPTVFDRYPKDNPGEGQRFDTRWVDNFGDYRSRMMRYGGEWGGMPALHHFGPRAKTLIEGEYAWAWKRHLPQTTVVADAPDADVKIFGLALSQYRNHMDRIGLLWRDKDGAERPIPNPQMHFTNPTHD